MDPMEKPSVLRIGRALIMDELYLYQVQKLFQQKTWKKEMVVEKEREREI